jgi:hypothetical protein
VAFDVAQNSVGCSGRYTRVMPVQGT